MKETDFPRLMRDDSEYDGHAEAIMDYVISWCLRRAQSCCAYEKPILYDKCRFILSKILDINNAEAVEFTSVKVWKQWENMDLVVEVETLTEGTAQKYAILIENKYYTPLHQSTDRDGKKRNQLEVYRKKFDAHYKVKDHLEQQQLRYVLITCIDRNDEKFRPFYKEAENLDFAVYSFNELLKDTKPTESDIFNEFWINW